MNGKDTYCPFCNPEYGREIILGNELCYCVYDGFPVSKGHALIITKRHCADYFELNTEEQSACWNMVNALKDILTQKYHPDGYNIGININEAAGQTIPHVHIHLILRYKGDVEEPEGGVRGVIPEKRLYRPKKWNKPLKIDNIRELLENISDKRFEEIKEEVHGKESLLIHAAEAGGVFDKTHRDMVMDAIRDNKSPSRPETINRLMLQLISSAFSYNRVRNQLKRINKSRFHHDYYPILDDHKLLLGYILNDERFKDEDFWHPVRFKALIEEIKNTRKYEKVHELTDYWLTYLLDILSTAPAKLIEITNQNVTEFYDKVDEICNQGFNDDIFFKAEVLWRMATDFSTGIRNVGSNLMCDFLKESGFTDYAKMDVHMIRSMSEVLQFNKDDKLPDYESFATTQWLASKLGMTPYRLDKILYVFGVYRKAFQ
ncbi:MAG TPA: HIT family protein [Paludibacter sp.]|nr:HIT family protein [Paludibacter sp.]